MYDSQETQPHSIYDPESTTPHQPMVSERTVPAVEQVYVAPPPPPRKPPKKKRKTLGCLLKAGGVLAVLLVLGVGLSVLTYNLFPPKRMNILILGVDARPGESSATRTDVMMLTTIDPKQPYVGVLSIPRDMYVQIPGYGQDRINAAHVLGELEREGYGPDLAAQTITETFAVPVDRTVRVNFDAFVAVIDAAGGVTIDVPSYFIDYEYPTDDYGTIVVEFEAGEQTMDGERALQYSRVRHGSSDFVRAERQQQVIEALIRKLASPGNWRRWPAVYRTLQDNTTTDLTAWDIIKLTPAILSNGPTNIDRAVLNQDYVYFTTTPGGASVLLPNWEVVNPLLDEMFRR